MASDRGKSLPGFYYDPETRRYYALKNCSAKFLEKIKQTEQKEKNQEATLKFKLEPEEQKKRKKAKNNLLAIFSRREYGLGIDKKFHEKLAPLFTARLHLKDCDPIITCTQPLSPQRLPWIRAVQCEEPNSFILGLYLDNGSNQVIQLTPEKVVESQHGGDRTPSWTIKKTIIPIVVPEMAHRLVYVQPDFVSRVSVHPQLQDLPHEQTPLSNIHLIGVSLDDPGKINYYLNTLILKKGSRPGRYISKNQNCPLNTWPWEEMDNSKAFFQTHHRKISFGYRQMLAQKTSKNGRLAFRSGLRMECFDLQYCECLPTGRSSPTSALYGYSNGSINLSTFEKTFPHNVQHSEMVKCSNYSIRSVHFHPSKVNQFVVSGDESFLKLFDRRFLKRNGITVPVVSYVEHRSKNLPYQVNLDASTDLLVSSGVDGMVRFWNISTGKLVNLIEPFKDNCESHCAYHATQAYYCSNFCAHPDISNTEVLLTLNGSIVKTYFSEQQSKFK